VVTSGGIYGKVKEIKDTTVIVEIAENVRIKVDKNSVFASAESIDTPVK
jgi:preprotein translocase subunit YajC